MRRALALVAVLTIAALAASGCCQEPAVKVKTGEQVVCTYGEMISSTVKEVEVPSSEADKYKITTRKTTCARHRSLEALYEAAQKAIAEGDLKAARDKLAQVLALDSSFAEAAAQASEIDAGKTPATDTGSTKPATETVAPEAPVASLLAWVPDQLPGYTSQPLVSDAFALTREYLPTSTGSIDVMVVVVEQSSTPDFAKKLVADIMRRGYSANRQKVSVEGRTLEFGTNGSKFAALAWNEGAIVVVVEAAASDGSAAGLKSDLQTIAGTLIP